MNNKNFIRILMMTILVFLGSYVIRTKNESIIYFVNGIGEDGALLEPERMTVSKTVMVSF